MNQELSSSSTESSIFSQVLAELATLRQQVIAQQQEISSLKLALSKSRFSQAEQAEETGVKTSRRRLLRSLATGLTATIVAGSLTTIIGPPQEAQARFVSNPRSKIGAIILPNTSTFVGNPANPVNSFGLIASSDNILNLSSIVSSVGNNAVIGFSDSNNTGNGVYGRAGSTGGSGVYGENTNGGYGVSGRSISAKGFGVWGDTNNTGNYPPSPVPFAASVGVVGTSTQGYGVYAQGATAPLILQKGVTQGAPSTGKHYTGEFYVDSDGSLFYCYSGDGTSEGTWKQVAP